MLKFTGLVLGAFIAAAPMAMAQSAAPPASPDKPRTVQLTRMVTKLPPGKPWAVLQRGMFCSTYMSQSWSGGQTEFRIATVMDTFRAEMKAAGLAPEEEASLFDPSAVSPSEFALAGVIVDENVKVCAPDASPQGVNNLKGDVSMTVDWQLYSRVEKQVVATAHTTGAITNKDPTPGGATAMINRAFAENVKALAADPAIRKALAGRALAENELVKPPVQPALAIPGTQGLGGRSIDQASQSVMVIYAGQALGSGVLISRDGYALTAAHVVGDNHTVRLRWPDGKTAVGEVVRVSKERDAALLKIDPAGHAPLAIRQDTPSVGATVFAIGAPEGEKYEATVTRGVVSGTRIFQGFSYIQSDVTAGHGMSGGPLVDEAGYVVGLTESGTHNQTSSGIGLFTPIRDAVAFLGLELR